MPTSTRYTYLGPEYDHTGGVLLPGMVGLPLYPHKMSDDDIALILDEYPKLRKFWHDSFIITDGGGGTGGGTDTSTWKLDWTPLRVMTNQLSDLIHQFV
jgi:hypothetical protein